MKIDTTLIKSFNPCKDRLDNYLKNYESFSGTLREFFALEEITYEDKIWVSKRAVPRVCLIKWACACASSVLSIFEKKYPDDKRPRLAIEVASNPNSTREQILEARTAAAAAYAAAAADAAYAYAYAAAAAAYAAAAAAAYAAAAADAAYAYAAAAAAADAYAYAYAAAAYAADAADAAAYADARQNARKKQQRKNLDLMLEIVEAENDRT